MTDDLMDARLRTAGQNWRAANASEAEVDAAAGEQLDLGTDGRRHRARWVTLASAAVVAAALVAGGVALGRSGDQNKPAPGAAATPTVVAAPTSRLLGVTWVDKGSGGTVVFTADTARTYDGCKDALHRLSLTGDHLSLGQAIGQTGMCSGVSRMSGVPDPEAARLAKLYRILRGPSQWSVTGKTLTLTSASGGVVLLTTNGQPAPMLVGTSWTLNRVQTDRELPGSYSSATLAIDSTGQFSANDLCNTLSGTAKSTASTVDFGSVATTARGCPDVPPANRVIDGVLSGAASYSIRGNELILSNSAGLLGYLPAKLATPDDGVSTLTGRSWKLTGTQTTSASGGSGSGSGSSAVGVTVLQFDGDMGFTLQHGCYTNKGKAVIGPGTIELSGITLKSAVPCVSPLTPVTEEDNFVDDLLTGHVTWSVDAGQLTIAKADGHSATFSS